MGKMENRKWVEINSTGLRKIFYYLIFGFFTTLLSVLSYSFLVWMNIHYMVSNILAFIIAVAFAYETNRRWVFVTADPDKPDLKEFLRFVSSRISTLILESFVLFIFISFLGFNPYGVKIIANILVIFSNYFLSEFMVFRKKETAVKGV